MDKCEKRRYTIAIMVGDIQSDYSEELLCGFFACAKEENVNIVFLMGPQIPQYCTDILALNLDGNYNYQFDTIYDYVSFVNADALIIIYGSVSSFCNVENKSEFLKRYANIPYLILEDTAEHAPYQISDNFSGMHACVEHLVVDHGYRKIAFLSGPRTNREANERMEAYREVMQKHGLAVPDSMIAYGDYTDQVREQVNRLLDENPGLEAIVCANDNMAKGCYQICHERKLQIGKQIAITGYDDVEMTRMMTPPLTSVSQGSLKFSYTALKSAIALCEGKRVESCRMPTALQRRASCGCSMEGIYSHTYVPPEKMEQFILRTTDKIAADILGGIPYKKERNHYTALIREYFHYIYVTIFGESSEELQMDYLLDILRQFIAYPHVSSIWLFERFSNLIQVLIANAQDGEKQKQLAYIVSRSQQFIHSSDSLKMEQRMMSMNRKAWFVPTFTRDLNRRGEKDDYREVLLPMLERLRMMNVRSCYIYLFQKPFEYDQKKHDRFPSKMYLTAFYNKNEMKCYPNYLRPEVCAANGFTSFLPKENAEILTSFLLFSGEKQYGVMLCDVDQEDISFLQISSLQIGSLFRYLELNWMEQDAHAELRNSLKVIKEKNHILSFISEYDELTNLLNRRGFMEHAISCCKESDGRRAYLIFCDLDHLKEINDCFGHAAGDYAIKVAAARLKDVLPKDSVTARIGGDEFVSFMVTELPGFSEAITEALKDAGDRFNHRSGLPYYIELSVGIHAFYCDPRMKIGEIMKRSDELLYLAKQNRRKSIKKEKELPH